MDQEFFERLYKGYLGEHLISGELYANSFEVFRLPADFGFDLVVTNQFKMSQGRTDAAGSFPFSIQVKSRWVRDADISAGPNNRPEAEFAYWLKQGELDLLSRHPNSAVAFVFYLPGDGREGVRSRFFLVHSHDMGRLRDSGYLRPAQNGFELRVRYRDRPMVSRDQLVGQMLDAGEVTAMGAGRLRSSLPESFRLNWNAHEYFLFARESRHPDHHALVWRQVDLCTELSGFPNFQQIALG